MRKSSDKGALAFFIILICLAVLGFGIKIYDAIDSYYWKQKNLKAEQEFIEKRKKNQGYSSGSGFSGSSSAYSDSSNSNGSSQKSNSSGSSGTSGSSNNSSSGSKSHSSTYHDNYDDGYNDIYEEDDYDWDRYQTDQEYANGVDDAMEDADEEFGDDW